MEAGKMRMFFLVTAMLPVILEPVIASKAGVALVNNLLDNYPKYYVRPVSDEESAIVVKHRMTPIQLIDMDEKNQVVILKTWLAQVSESIQEWTDDYLFWNPALYSGIKQIQIPITNIWQPDTVLYGSVTSNFQRHFDTDAIINHNGTVTALQPAVIEATCSIDATLFPFDEQRCVFKFASWSYHGGLIDYEVDPTSNIDRFTQNGEWEVLEMPVEKRTEKYVCCPELFPDVTYTIHLRRRSMFYIVNIILPSFLASILISVGFYLPSDSGERVSLCVISILSQFVFLTVISDYMPPTAEVVPYLQRYFFVTIGLAVLSAFVMAYTLSMHFPGPVCPEVPRHIKVVSFRFLARLACTRVRIKSYRVAKPRRLHDESEEISLGPYFSGKKVGAKLSNNCQLEQTEAMPTSDSEIDSEFCDHDLETQQRRLREWREVSRITDRSYMVLYTLSQIILLLFFLIFISIMGKASHQEEEH